MNGVMTADARYLCGRWASSSSNSSFANVFVVSGPVIMSAILDKFCIVRNLRQVILQTLEIQSTSVSRFASIAHDISSSSSSPLSPSVIPPLFRSRLKFTLVSQILPIIGCSTAHWTDVAVTDSDSFSDVFCWPVCLWCSISHYFAILTPSATLSRQSTHEMTAVRQTMHAAVVCTLQTYRLVWSHHLRVSVQLYVRLSTRWPRGRRRAVGHYEQVRVSVSVSLSRPRCYL